MFDTSHYTIKDKKRKLMLKPTLGEHEALHVKKNWPIVIFNEKLRINMFNLLWKWVSLLLVDS